MIIPAKYTEVVDNLLQNEQTAEAINNAMSTYPLYETDPDAVRQYGTAYAVPTRAELNGKILSYYRYNEIGFETVGRWLFELETALNEIMPYYNQLFYSADQDFNPIYNVDYKKIINGVTNNTSNTTSSGSDTSSTTEYGKGVNSKTPADLLSISNEDIDDVNYADDASWSKNSGSGSTSSTASSNNSSNGSNSTIESTKGNFGVTSAQDLIIKYRDCILNIEQQIINDPRIKELFMLIF